MVNIMQMEHLLLLNALQKLNALLIVKKFKRIKHAVLMLALLMVLFLLIYYFHKVEYELTNICHKCSEINELCIKCAAAAAECA